MGDESSSYPYYKEAKEVEARPLESSFRITHNAAMNIRRIYLISLIATLSISLPLAGCGNDSADSGNDSVIPTDGNWEGSPISFTLTPGGIEEIELAQFGCLGDVAPTGLALCSSILDSNWVLPDPVQVIDGQFSISTPFGLALNGEFTDEHQMTGTYEYESDSGCCASEGNWMTVHETIAADAPPAICHEETGEEIVTLLLQENGETIGPLEPGAKTRVTPGFQGGIMLVLELELGNINLGGDISFDVDLVSLSSGINAQARARAIDLELQEDSTLRWDPVWLLLFSEQGDMLNLGDLNMLTGAEGQILLKISNSCGYRYQATVDIVLASP